MRPPSTDARYSHGSFRRVHDLGRQSRNRELLRLGMIGWIVAGVVLAALNQWILPRKYFFDSGNIASRFGQTQGFEIGDSYDNTARLYDLTGLAQSQMVTALLTVAIYGVFLLRCYPAPERVDRRALLNLIVFGFACVTGAIYLGQYSKESIVLLCVIAFFSLSRGRRQWLLVWVPLVVIYATWFRTYWFLVLAMYCYYALAFRVARNMPMLVASVMLAFLLLAVAFHTVLGVDLAFYRYTVNETRLYDANANTMILPLLPTGNVALEWANAVLQFLLMFMPVPLLDGNPVYAAFFLVSMVLGRRLWTVLRDAMAVHALAQPARETRCVALLLAFVTIQSIFEPDYGSYIKHLTPMLPIFLYVFGWHQRIFLERRGP